MQHAKRYSIYKLLFLEGSHARTKEGEVWVWQFKEDIDAEDDEESDREPILVIIFATTGNLQHMSRANVWYGDGTFKVCPNPFYQLYTLHAEVHGQILPLVFTLLPSKSSKCYRFMWMKLKELMAQHGIFSNLREFRSDLEVAPMKTVLPVFTPDSVATCFFHFAQAHWRKIQSLGLVRLYDDENYSLLLRCFTALAFVPEDRVVEYFKTLCESVPEDAPEQIHAFVDYMAETYIGRDIYETVSSENSLVLRIRRQAVWKEPKFSPKLWSVYERVLNDEPRTTNRLEGWHRRFSQIVAKAHPNIYNFIRCA